MEKKNITEVVIDGTIYRLGGYESTEYLQQVAAYINSKITEMKALDGYSHLPTSQKALMMELNAADDYFKAKKSVERLEKELSDKDKELYNVKHDLVELQVKMEEANRSILSLKEERAERQPVKFAGDLPEKAERLPEAMPEKTESQIEVAESLPEKTGDQTEKDTGDVFRPDSYPEEEKEGPAEEKEDEGASPEKSAKTFVPEAAGREQILRNARSSFLASQNSYGRNRNRRH